MFMPDHLHLVIEGLDRQSSFVRFMSVFRRRSSTSRSWAGRGRLWQDGYFERVLREDERTDGVAAYVVMNPVRAGLVERWQTYPYSWANGLKE